MAMATAKKGSLTSVSSDHKPCSQPAVTKTNKAASSKEKPIKYTDKSIGQPKLIPVFNSIKALMKPYVEGTLKERGEAAGIYNLVSEKHVEIEGRKKDEVYFANIIIMQKGYVSFYFMPVYGCNKPGEIFHPNLLKLLKSKACFHIKRTTRIC